MWFISLRQLSGKQTEPKVLAAIENGKHILQSLMPTTHHFYSRVFYARWVRASDHIHIPWKKKSSERAAESGKKGNNAGTRAKGKEGKLMAFVSFLSRFLISHHKWAYMRRRTNEAPIPPDHQGAGQRLEKFLRVAQSRGTLLGNENMTLATSTNYSSSFDGTVVPLMRYTRILLGSLEWRGPTLVNDATEKCDIGWYRCLCFLCRESFTK